MYNFKLDSGFSIDLEKDDKVFTPTGTSKVLVEAIIENVKEKRKILDLGCGCGAIGLSLFKNSFNSGSMMWSNSQKDIANYYNLYSKIMSFWKAKFKDSIYEVKYEDLVNKPDEEIRNLIKFCNLKWDAKCLNFYENKKTPIQTVSLVQARKPIYKSSVNSSTGYSQYLQEMYDILDTN